MGYNELEIELRKLLSQIARWREAGAMPTIEQGIALGRLQNIYAGLLDLPGDGAVADIPDTLDALDTLDTPDAPEIPDLPDLPDAPEDESFDLTEPAEQEDRTVEVTDDADSTDSTDATAVSDRSEEDHHHTEKAEQKQEQRPKIFGIEVGAYTRHEIVDTLFHGNTELFETECAKLDQMDSLDEALVYIGETYHWIPDNAATVKFVDLLESRFMDD